MEDLLKIILVMKKERKGFRRSMDSEVRLSFFKSNFYGQYNSPSPKSQQQISRNKLQNQQIMQNYQFSQSYPMGHTLTYQNPYYYQPIMFINPSMHMMTSGANPYFNPNTAPLQHLENYLHEDIKEQFIVKVQSENQSNKYAQKYNEKTQVQQKIQFLYVQNRNILPNNLNLILSYIRRINKSGKIVKKVIDKLDKQKQYSLKKFYSYQTYLKEQTPFHKTKYTLKQITEYSDSNFTIFTEKQQRFYNKVCKIERLYDYFTDFKQDTKDKQERSFENKKIFTAQN